MDTIINDPFLQRVSTTAGQSNTVAISRDDKHTVQAALAQIRGALHTVDHSKEHGFALRALADQLEVAIAPHKILPPEVLARIFSELAPLSATPHSRRLPDHRTYGAYRAADYLDVGSWIQYEPRTIRAVCSSWRQIALNHHALWSKIQLQWPPNQLHGVSINAMVNKILDILPANGPVSLLVWVMHFGRRLHSTDSHVDFVSRHALPLAQQLHSLAINTHTTELLSLFNLPSGITFPSLRFVDITMLRDVPGTPEVGPVASGKSIFDNSPALQNLKLTIGRFQPLVFSGQLPWSRMTRLHLSEPIKPNTLARVLADSSDLLSLSVVLNPSPSFHPRRTIDLPRLDELELDMKPGSEVFLDSLHVPALSRLTLTCCPSPAIQKASALISRCACIIKVFRNRWEPNLHPLISRDEFNDLLARMPLLQELNTGTILEESLITAIGSGASFPHLEILCCTSPLSTPKFLDALESGLNARNANAPPRTNLHLINRMATTHDGECERPLMLQRIRELRTKYDIRYAPLEPLHESMFDMA